ncbi:hypothetical protein ALC53_05003 [Atta colombica]|uniref:Uncharacterized protein n=1 Tax=Atta colombica TaxID=520822 RepID=A0A195BJD3_9HYME|nr:hypothetical protein ALC53_05003 [Atta colombica]
MPHILGNLCAKTLIECGINFTDISKNSISTMPLVLFEIYQYIIFLIGIINISGIFNNYNQLVAKLRTSRKQSLNGCSTESMSFHRIPVDMDIDRRFSGIASGLELPHPTPIPATPTPTPTPASEPAGNKEDGEEPHIT